MGTRVKIRLEIPDALLRRVKTVATLRGMLMRELIIDSLEASLAAHAPTATPRWRKLAGKAQQLDTAPVREALAEFGSRARRGW